jgi:CNT family concentrative nucleoside transporter
MKTPFPLNPGEFSMILQSLAGLIVFVGFAWAVSENRRAVDFRLAAAGVALQFLLGMLLLRLPLFRGIFLQLNRLVLFLEESTRAGTRMVFGYLGGGTPPFESVDPGAEFILAFRALPLVLVISALSALLFHWRVLPLVVRAFSRLLQRSLRLGGAEGVGVSANVFVGMVEAPLFVRPYLARMTRSELFTLMTCGMATIAGTVMVLYASLLADTVPNIMGHILTASLISVPAAITIAKVMVPETEPPTAGEIAVPDPASGAMDAVTRGAIQGVELIINIVAMLVVLVALVHLVNLILGLLPSVAGGEITLQRLLGWLLAPVVWLAGVPWSEAVAAGGLMGTKTVLNEFVAYLELANLPPETFSPRSRIILIYALCGFANPGSLGIMIGGMGAMAPERRDEIVALGFRSIVAGTLATLMTGTVAGILLA